MDGDAAGGSDEGRQRKGKRKGRGASSFILFLHFGRGRDEGFIVLLIVELYSVTQFSVCKERPHQPEFQMGKKRQVMLSFSPYLF